MSRVLVIYHGGCRDGFCAAWVCSGALSCLGVDRPKFHAGYYGQPPPLEDAHGRDVVLVDFSYPLAEMEALADAAATLLVLDHHKTAEETMLAFKRSNARVIFDMNRSGAGLAWDWFAKDGPNKVLAPKRSWLVDYTEDRDLWRFALPASRIYNAYISTLPFDFMAWDDADGKQDGAHEAGEAVIAKTEQYVREVAKNVRRWTFEGHDVPIVNAPQVDISELLDHLVQGETFAMGWWQRADGMFQYSLRSRGDFDVSVLAKKYGGGGHKNAAGFQSATLLSASAGGEAG